MIDAREGRHAVEGERIAMVGGRVRATTGLREPDLSTWYLKPFYSFRRGSSSTLVFGGRTTGFDKDLFVDLFHDSLRQNKFDRRAVRKAPHMPQ